MELNKSVYGELNNSTYWYALHTRARHEKKVDLRLKQRGVSSYLPLNTVYRRWSDRYKKVLEPLFSCYVFVNITLRDRLRVLQTEGTLSLVSFNGIPAKVTEEQINAIKHILESKQSVDYADYFTPGKKIKIVEGPLRGLNGTLVTHKNNNRLVIAIDGIKQAISVEIDPRDVVLM